MVVGETHHFKETPHQNPTASHRNPNAIGAPSCRHLRLGRFAAASQFGPYLRHGRRGRRGHGVVSRTFPECCYRGMGVAGGMGDRRGRDMLDMIFIKYLQLYIYNICISKIYTYI